MRQLRIPFSARECMSYMREYVASECGGSVGEKRMKFLQVDKWDDYQHYHDGRRPTWIKFYVDLLNPSKHPKYHALTDGAKLTLHHLWLLAAECDNRIPETWLTRERLNIQTKPRLEELLNCALVNWYETSSPHVSVSESKSCSESEKLNSWQESVFAGIWPKYPKPIGKRGALKHFKSTVRSEDDLSNLRSALEKYLASGDVARGYVKNASTWFGEWQDWAEYQPKAMDTMGYTRDEWLQMFPSTPYGRRDLIGKDTQ